MNFVVNFVEISDLVHRSTKPRMTNTEGRKVGPTADAKEVGVGNPAEENDPPPDLNSMPKV